MKTFIISYDLHNANEEEYRTIDRWLSRLGGHKQLESTWLWSRDESWDPSRVINYLLEFIDGRHDIFVGEIKQLHETPICDWHINQCN